MDKWKRFSVVVLITLSLTIGFETYQVLASPSPSVNRVYTPGTIGPCTWFVSMDGTTPVAEAMVGGLSVDPGDNIIGTSGQDVAAFLNSIVATKQSLCLASPAIFTFTTTFNVPTSFSIFGGGSGNGWSGIESSQTEIKCNLSSNNIPCIKLSNPTLAEGYHFENFKVFYTGSTTGTDGIYIDGVTSIARRIDIYNVNIVSFSGYCLHGVGTVFDVRTYSLGSANCSQGGVLVDPGATGVPTQWIFYSPLAIENVANKWAMNFTSTSIVSIIGGTIANGNAGGNGIFLKGGTGQGIYGTNIEGALNVGIGVQYTSGTGLSIDAGIIQSWSTGLEIGPDPSGTLAAVNWYSDAKFASNTIDIKITAGGSRTGIIRPTSSSSLTTLTNNRGASDGVWWDITRWYYDVAEPAASSITVTASIFRYDNHDFYNQGIYISGGTVSNVTLSPGFGLGKQVASSTNTDIFCRPGCSIFVTYSSAPTMVKTYGGP